MKYDVHESEEHKGEWIAGAVEEPEGDIYIAIFSGPDAKERAVAYAMWQNSKELNCESHGVHATLSS